MPLAILGIDPGATGAVCLIDRNGAPLIELLAEITPGWLRGLEYQPMDMLAVIEKVGARPGQGVTSMFTFGQGYGRILGWLEALEIPHVRVTPQIWQRDVHRGCPAADSKARSLEAARRLFPAVNLKATPRSKTPHKGIIDALLIAEHGRRQYLS